MKKRKIVLALSMVLTLTLSWCGKTSATSEKASNLKDKTLQIYSHIYLYAATSNMD